ncbi:hypothetical protein NRA64_18565, partial [Acinetobacter baumannii]|nr:hypothetical protein [Acinetobacter baumannii]
MATVLGIGLVAGPFLPGSFLSAAQTGSAAVVTASAEEVLAPFGEPSTPCSVTDVRLPEISGMAVSGDTTLVMNDGGDAVTVYLLDASCAVVGE